MHFKVQYEYIAASLVLCYSNIFFQQIPSLMKYLLGHIAIVVYVLLTPYLAFKKIGGTLLNAISLFQQTKLINFFVFGCILVKLLWLANNCNRSVASSMARILSRIFLNCKELKYSLKTMKHL